MPRGPGAASDDAGGKDVKRTACLPHGRSRSPLHCLKALDERLNMGRKRADGCSHPRHHGPEGPACFEFGACFEFAPHEYCTFVRKHPPSKMRHAFLTLGAVALLSLLLITGFVLPDDHEATRVRMRSEFSLKRHVASRWQLLQARLQSLLERRTKLRDRVSPTGVAHPNDDYSWNQVCTVVCDESHVRTLSQAQPHPQSAHGRYRTLRRRSTSGSLEHTS